MLNWFRGLISRLFPNLSQAVGGAGVYPIKKVDSFGSLQPLLVSDIPQDYTHILIEAQLKIDASSDNSTDMLKGVRLTFNLDGGVQANYHSQFLMGVDRNVDTHENSQQSEAGNIITARSAMNELASLYIFIPNYSKQGIAKKAYVFNAFQPGYGANGFAFPSGLGFIQISWVSDSPINMVTLTPDGWNNGHFFTLNSYMKVFGIKDGLD